MNNLHNLLDRRRFVEHMRAVFVMLLTCVVPTAALGQPEVSEKACPLEVIEAPTQDRQLAIAVVRKPPGEGPFPVVIHLHGGLGTNSVEKSKQLLRGQTFSRFLAAGYVTVAATFRSRAEDPQTLDALRDCQAIIEHVRKMPEVDPKSIVLWGQSGGGSLALELAGETPLCAIAVEEPATVLFTGMFNKTNLKGKPPYKVGSGRHIMEAPQSFYTPELQKHAGRKSARSTARSSSHTATWPASTRSTTISSFQN